MYDMSVTTNRVTAESFDLDWIRENVKHKYRHSLQYKMKTPLLYVFYFEDDEEAALFKLTFGVE